MKLVRLVLVLVVLRLFTGVMIAQEPYTETDLTIEMSDDWQAAAKLTVPNTGEEIYPTVILIHGSGVWDMDAAYPDAEGNIASQNFKLLAERFADEGIATLRYNKRGVISYGEYDMAQANRGTIPTLIADAEAVLDAALAQPTTGDVYLFGWSEGTWVASHLGANRDADVAGVILLAPPNAPIGEALQYQQLEVSFGYIRDVVDADGDSMLTFEEAEAIPSNTPVQLTSQFYVFAPAHTSEQPMFSPFSDINRDGLLNLETELKPTIERGLAMMNRTTDDLSRVISDVLAETELPILLLHGENDGYVPIGYSEQIAEALPQQATLLSYEGVGHALSPAEIPAFDSFGVMIDMPIADTITWIAAQ